MIRSFYTATAGAKSSQNKLDIHANNIANVNTTGYKAGAASFTETLYSNFDNGIAVGSGVRLQEISLNFAPGHLEYTGNKLDFAIEGEGFFAVNDNNGNISYTRSGNFALTEENGESYLVTVDGQWVLDENMERIQVTGDSVSLPGIFTFPNPYGLQVVGSGRYLSTPMSGESTVLEGDLLKNEHLESSSVDLITELSNMIQAQRAYQFNAKMIQTADELEQMANNLR